MIAMAAKAGSTPHVPHRPTVPPPLIPLWARGQARRRRHRWSIVGVALVVIACFACGVVLIATSEGVAAVRPRGTLPASQRPSSRCDVSHEVPGQGIPLGCRGERAGTAASMPAVGCRDDPDRGTAVEVSTPNECLPCVPLPSAAEHASSTGTTSPSLDVGGRIVDPWLNLAPRSQAEYHTVGSVIQSQPGCRLQLLGRGVTPKRSLEEEVHGAVLETSGGRGFCQYADHDVIHVEWEASVCNLDGQMSRIRSTGELARDGKTSGYSRHGAWLWWNEATAMIVVVVYEHGAVVEGLTLRDRQIVARVGGTKVPLDLEHLGAHVEAIFCILESMGRRVAGIVGLRNGMRAANQRDRERAEANRRARVANHRLRLERDAQALAEEEMLAAYQRMAANYSSCHPPRASFFGGHGL
jgi:hypothetical protein